MKWRQHGLDVGRASEEYPDGVWNRRAEVRLADDRRQRHEVWRHENDLRPDLVADKIAIEYLLAAARRMHCNVSQPEILLHR